MRSPQEMQVIQIDITNACVHSCSNCTRLCGHHKRNFFMNWETFQRAVNSLEGFEGTIGMMGGEPTLHPEFKRFAAYLGEKISRKKETSCLIKPAHDFMRIIGEEEMGKWEVYGTAEGSKTRISGAGLWSSLVSNYYKYYELIQDTFRHQMLNDHTAASYHQPVLVSRRELGIKDEEWRRLRDACWVQNEWSATITPKGAFFCEVAGALDMLFDGPGGWPVEPGWWKRKPEEFGDQLHWCEMCGMALETCTRNANDGIDDISPAMYEKIKDIGGSKVKDGRIHILKIDKDGGIRREDEADIRGLKKYAYLEDYSTRFDKERGKLYPKGFQGLVFYDESCEMERFCMNMENNKKQLDELFIVTKRPETSDRLRTRLTGSVKLLHTNYNGFGTGLNLAFSRMDPEKWVVFFTPDMCFSDSFKRELSEYVLNPGTIHARQYGGKEYSPCRWLKSRGEKEMIALFHLQASALLQAGFDGIGKTKDFGQFLSLWKKEKQLDFSDEVFTDPEEAILPGKKYIVYGIGRGGLNTTRYIRQLGSEVICYCDSSERNWGKTFEGRTVLSPEEVKQRQSEADKILIASSYFSEIRPMLLKLGIPEEKIAVASAAL